MKTDNKLKPVKITDLKKGDVVFDTSTISNYQTKLRFVEISKNGLSAFEYVSGASTYFQDHNGHILFDDLKHVFYK